MLKENGKRNHFILSRNRVNGPSASWELGWKWYQGLTGGLRPNPDKLQTGSSWDRTGISSESEKIPFLWGNVTSYDIPQGAGTASVWKGTLFTKVAILYIQKCLPLNPWLSHTYTIYYQEIGSALQSKTVIPFMRLDSFSSRSCIVHGQYLGMGSLSHALKSTN